MCGGICLDNACNTNTATCVNGLVVCTRVSPIIIDWDGSGIDLTSVADGKKWTIFATGPAVQVSWIDPASTAAFLVLPEPDGEVHNGADMFGNLTPQPTIAHKNGFNALSVYDTNNDSVIDANDPIWTKLRLMRADMSLHTMEEYGVTAISLDYQKADKKDDNGNIGEFKSRVITSDSRRNGTVAYDWFLAYTPAPGGTPACKAPSLK